MKRIAKWIIVHCIFAAVIILAVFYEIKWAENISLFLIWTMLPLYLFAAINKETRKKLYEKGRSVPDNIAYCYDIALVLILVAFGWIWSGVAYFLSSSFESYIYTADPWVEK